MNCLVFTETSEIEDYCSAHGIDYLKVSRKNEYNMPTLKDMVIDAQHRYKCDYVIYINSDILINPNLFKSIYYLESLIGRNVCHTNDYSLGFLWIKCISN